MRSSDIWLGWPYDVFNFTMLSAYIMLRLRDKYPFMNLGSMFFEARSQHAYAKQFPVIRDILKYDASVRAYQALDPMNQFNTADELVERLWKAARTTGALQWAQDGWR
jgi:thymidylate synthase